MRKSYLVILTMGLIIIFLGCSNELDLLSPSQDLPVVYGLMTYPDTSQYIRVERAFLTDGDPQLAAQNPDSIYYDQIQVYINDTQLSELRGIEVVPFRDLGYFLSNPNVVFRLPQNSIQINPGSLYTLTIRRAEKELARAQTTLTSLLTVFSPRKSDLLSFDRANVTYRWSNQDDHVLYDIKATIHIEEIVDNSVRQYGLEWILALDFEASRLEFNGDLFYEFLGSQLDAVPGVQRMVVGIDLIFVAAGDEYARFRSINQNNSGITGFQQLPEFSNIENGLGLFSSRSYEILEGLQLTRGSIEQLGTHPATTSLGF